MDFAQASLLTRAGARRFDAAVFALALVLRLGFLAIFQAQGLGEAYGRDLYYSLAQSWLGWAPVWALLAYLTAVHAVFFTSLRYRLPLEPFLCLLAAAGLGALLRGRSRA